MYYTLRKKISKTDILNRKNNHIEPKKILVIRLLKLIETSYY